MTIRFYSLLMLMDLMSFTLGMHTNQDPDDCMCQVSRPFRSI